MRVRSCIADSDAPALLVALVHSDVVSNRFPHGVAARTSSGERDEVGVISIDAILRGHNKE